MLFSERLFSKASLRILLSDTAADITGLPTVTRGPVNCSTANWNIAANVPAGLRRTDRSRVARPPVALSPGDRTATTIRRRLPAAATWTINACRRRRSRDAVQAERSR